MDIKGLHINVTNKKESHLVQDIFLYFGAYWIWKGEDEKEDDITFNGMFTYPRCLFVDEQGYIDVKNAVNRYEENISLAMLIETYNTAKYKKEIEEFLTDKEKESDDYLINITKDSIEIEWKNNKYTTDTKTNYKYNMETLMFLKGLLSK